MAEISQTRLPKLEGEDGGGVWVDWGMAQVLMREAKALIEGQPAANDSQN